MKSLSLVFRILAIAAGVAAIVVFFLINGKLAEKDAELNQVRASRTAVQSELETSQATAATLRTELNSARAEAETTGRNLENTRAELVTARSESSRTNDRLRESQRELERARQDLTTVRRDLVTAQRQVEQGVSQEDFAALQAERDALQTRVGDLRTEVEMAQDQIRTVRATVAQATNGAAAPTERDRRVGRSAPESTGRFGASTAIASVDINNGLLTLVGGQNLELNVGDTVKLVSNLQAVAEIQISRVSANETVANILPGSPTRALRNGLEVRILH